MHDEHVIHGVYTGLERSIEATVVRRVPVRLRDPALGGLR